MDRNFKVRFTDNSHIFVKASKIVSDSNVAMLCSTDGKILATFPLDTLVFVCETKGEVATVN